MKLIISIVFLVGGYSAQAATVTVVNYSYWDIHFLYVSPSASNNWGPDQLGNAILGSNQQITLKMGIGDWDVRLVDEDGDECVVFAVPVRGGKDSWDITNDDLLECQSETETGGAYSAQAVGGTAELYNGTSFDIYEIYLSPSRQNSWGRDLLGNQILYSGQTFELSSIACDNYDVRLVDEDDDVCEYSGEYICGDAGTWHLTDEELLSCQGY